MYNVSAERVLRSYETLEGHTVLLFSLWFFLRKLPDYIDFTPAIMFFIADISPQTIPFSNR